MNQIILNMENSITPKAIPVIVPMAYQAILNLQEKINQADALMLKVSKSKTKRDEDGIPLWQRYSLSVPEAAKYFGIGETRLYQIVSEHPGADFILEIGSHVNVRRHIVGGANRTLFSVDLPPRWCRTGTCRRLQSE